MRGLAAKVTVNFAASHLDDVKGVCRLRSRMNLFPKPQLSWNPEGRGVGNSQVSLGVVQLDGTSSQQKIRVGPATNRSAATAFADFNFLRVQNIFAFKTTKAQRRLQLFFP